MNLQFIPQGPDGGFILPASHSGISVPDELEIFSAARYGDVDMIGRQIRAGIDLNVKHTGNPYVISLQSLPNNIRTKQYCPLHIAVMHSSLEVVQYLVDNGATVDCVDASERTPLYFSVFLGRCEIVQYLLDNGADVGRQSASKKTALMAAVLNRNYTMTDILVSAGTNLDLIDIKGSTAVYLAATSRESIDTRILERLLQGGCDVNKTNPLGASPLLMSIQARQIEGAKTLLRAGAHVNQADNSGQTALHIAVLDNRRPEMALMLMQHGADVNWRDNKGLSPLDKAIRFRKMTIIQLLLLADCEYTIEQLNHENIHFLGSYFPDFAAWIDRIIHTPKTLQRHSLKCIRNRLIKNNDNLMGTGHLNLPTVLRDNITHKSLDRFIENIPRQRQVIPTGGVNVNPFR